MATRTASADLLDRYFNATTLAEAEAALEEAAASPGARTAGVGDCFDELAEIAADEEDFAVAVRAQRRAVEVGCEYPVLARQMLGWYLMKDGQTVAGEAEFSALRRELGDDPQLLIALGNARSDAGRAEDALAAFDEALSAAKETGDRVDIDMARRERRESRTTLGLPLDDDDLAAPLRGRRFERTAFSLAWFPRSERDQALARWPDLEDDLRDADAYCRHVESELRTMQADTGQRPTVAPLRVDALVAYAAAQGLDPGDGQTRARFAAELHRTGQAIEWPPGRNDHCWCDSGRKYKRCCGSS